jgi:hypothetical protein
MSDQAFRYVPREPTFQPSEARAYAAARWLEQTIGGLAVARALPAVEFVDAGQNWDGVRCPSCDADAEPWWGEAMSRAAESGFVSLQVRAPCCGDTVSLNELTYAWPVAFGSFVLEVSNPSRGGLSQQELHDLGEQLGCLVTQVTAHI